MKLLITGGAGFIGSNFIHYWLKNHPKDQIINLDSLTYAGHLDSLKDISHRHHYTFIKGDINDSDLVDSLMSQVDTVVHFAAETHVDRSIVDPMIFIKTNVIGTQILLEAAKKYQTRFHHISTDEVFGALALDSKKKFHTKTSSDHLVMSYHTTFGVPVTITNCSNNFGPYQDTEKFIPRAITNLLQGKNILIYGDGKYVRDWMHVEDHCRAIEMVILKGKLGNSYTVGGMSKDISNLDVAKKILKIMKLPESRIEYIKDRPGHDRRYAVSWKKINKELGWDPQESFFMRLRQTIDWYRANEWWWRDMKVKSEDFYKTK
ncbi:MAG: dTDP-glucose 4,6-dehydratase [Candidatus Collierbacteria bacterium GW2011_GWC2_43_12]|uniref:dTDP-glucose 4,6-dehydratase n=1 Tax=Candidatus Collierbacteria bacterium GW2011_GWC2_43_12 TaxID=1618390 RepID=A0A0G1G2K7_9BACT|nr:MAG: dTDP-glucose 4,6-dehydratase [Candidatus Collierbacteria bacterium GW2011_GWC2_43_12]